MADALKRRSLKLMFTPVLLSMVTWASCAVRENPQKYMTSSLTAPGTTGGETGLKTDTATFGTGCFWCTEAVFQELEGVLKATSGYSGGHIKNPTYKEVCEGTTGHAECIQVVYDPTKITYDELLEVFWQTHDPTTLNRQGNDVGTQYRSVVFYHNAEQKQKAEKYKAELTKSGAWDKPLVTEIAAYDTFYAAEDYHQDYYNNNGSQPYCYYVIKPKLEKFEKVFKSKLKKH
jgi:peptide-methionine (S)-S-oxide reductase